MKPRSLVLMALLVAGMVVVACGGGPERDAGGQIVGDGELGVFDFKVGDCFQDPESFADAAGTGVASVAAVPCGTPHDNEVYSLFDLTGRFQAWPGADAIEAAADELCFSAFQPYVGKDYETSRFDFLWLAPSQETWDDHNDREVVCFLYDVELAKLTGSMRNSGE